MKIKIPASIVSAEIVSERIKHYILKHSRKKTLRPFQAGSHIGVHLPGGLLRHYSLMGDPAESTKYELAVLKEPDGRGGSVLMHEFEVGDEIYITYPRNNFPLDETAKSYLLIAGGIGITPILAMASRLAAIGATVKAIALGRDPERFPFKARLSDCLGDENVTYHFDGGEPGNHFDFTSHLSKLDAGTQIYACGPGGLLDYLVAKADGLGLPIVVEKFSGVAVSEASKGESFSIRIASTGQILEVPENKSALAVLEENGFSVGNSCRGGVCGECAVKILSGEPVHRDSALRPEERETLWTACISRALGEIELAL